MEYRFRLSNKITAAWFLLDKATLSDWNRDVDHPEQRKRPLVKPLPDVDTALARVAADLPNVPKRLFPKQPSGEQVTALFHEAASRHGKPAHFVSDQGGQFVGEALEAALAERAVDHRKGASTARSPSSNACGEPRRSASTSRASAPISPRSSTSASPWSSTTTGPSVPTPHTGCGSHPAQVATRTALRSGRKVSSIAGPHRSLSARARNCTMCCPVSSFHREPHRLSHIS